MKKNAIISFSGIGSTWAKKQNEEFKKLKSFENYDTFFVVDKQRSWMNKINLNSIIEASKKYDSIITIGQSMGGFSAIVFSEYTKVSKAIAFAPQYSIHPDVVPWDHDWREYAEKIQEWKHRQLLFNDVTEYYIIMGIASENDKKHLELIPNKNNIKKIIFSDLHHNIADELKSQNKLYDLVEAIINGD